MRDTLRDTHIIYSIRSHLRRAIRAKGGDEKLAKCMHISGCAQARWNLGLARQKRDKCKESIRVYNSHEISVAGDGRWLWSLDIHVYEAQRGRGRWEIPEERFAQ